MSIRTSLALIALLLAGAVGLQFARERVSPAGAQVNMLYVSSPGLMRRLALSYDSLAADVYWMRALQHFGRTRLTAGGTKDYALLYPLLDITTALDPRFNIAYRFGAIFLGEPNPGGAGRPDEAIALLEKGLEAQPERWEFAQDIGFVHYWYRRDYAQAAEWFRKAAAIPGAPNWMAPLAAVTEAEGGNRASSRILWQEILANAEEDWVRDQGALRLRQLDALDQIEELERRVALYEERTGRRAQQWSDLGRLGLLSGPPVDPDGFEYYLDPSGLVATDPTSTINPLPDPERRR